MGVVIGVCINRIPKTERAHIANRVHPASGYPYIVDSEPVS